MARSWSGKFVDEKGLEIVATAPSSMSSSSSFGIVLAVMKTTGSAASCGCCLILRKSAGPSMPGIIQSSKTRSGLKRVIASMAASGSLTTSTIILPSFSSDTRTMNWACSSSST